MKTNLIQSCYESVELYYAEEIRNRIRRVGEQLLRESSHMDSRDMRMRREFLEGQAHELRDTFSEEEELMVRTLYSDYQTQSESHRYFLKELGDPGDPLETEEHYRKRLVFIHDWLELHGRSCDAYFHVWLKRRHEFAGDEQTKQEIPPPENSLLTLKYIR